MPAQVLSKMLVPHPIISEPKKVQVLYQGYSGWLSSGLKRWRIDKVSLMDSFGKQLSVCQKGLELESGVPVLLQLRPGDCSAPDASTDKVETINSNDNNNDTTGFIPLDSANNNKNNNNKFVPTPVVRIGNEAIRPTADDRSDALYQWHRDKERNELDSGEEVESNRAFNTKTLRSRKQTREGAIVEIAEPVLKKTLSKNARAHNIDKPEITEPILGPTTSKPLLNYDDYANDWPSSHDGKNLKRHDDDERDADGNPLRMIMMTVQFLPERLSRMFEQAEKYARETIFPLISQHTPKFITSFIASRDRRTHYVPLDHDDITPPSRIPVSPKVDFDPPDVPVGLSRTDPDGAGNATAPDTARSSESKSAQRLKKDAAKAELEPEPEAKAKGLYVDLPVFDDRDRGVKYIPLIHPDALDASERITKR